MRAKGIGVRVAVVASGIALLAGVTACGSEKSDSDKAKGESDKGGGNPAMSALAALQVASKHTDQQHSAKVDGNTKMGATSSEMNGSMDWADGMRAGMTITQHGGAVDQTPLGGKPLKARYTPEAMFMNLGDEFAASPESGGKHWVKYDYDTLTEKAGAAGAFLKDQMQNTDPARSVQLLIATGKVKSAGTESVRGVKATHYTGTVNVSELAKMQSKDLSEQDLQNLQTQLQQSGMETEDIDLWIDGDDLLVKKREKAESNQGTYDSTVYYSDYGVEVNVEEPVPSDTVNFEDVQQ